MPIVFGGESSVALKRAAALGDGWYGVGHTPQSAAARVTRCDVGRGSVPFETTVSHGAPNLDRDDARRYEDAGVHRVVVLPWRRGSEVDEALGRLADAVL